MDPLVRDGKRVPLTGPRAVGPFLLALGIKLPLLVGVLFPAALLWRCVSPFFTRRKAVLPRGDSGVTAAEDRVPLAARPYDVVLVGAGGFTGRLAARYLAQRYGTSVRWAIAGRHKGKLEAVRTELQGLDAALHDLPLIVADVLDPAQLPAVANQARVVLTTVGPFENYGRPLVQACAAYGTGYCDITGEYPWVRRSVADFDALARVTGARIVHCCGYDSVPTDLLTQRLAAELKDKHGEALASIKLYHELKGGISGGTIATMRNAVRGGGGGTPPGPRQDYDPLLRTATGAKSDAATKPAGGLPVGYSPARGRWTAPFIMAEVNFHALKRSNALNRYGPEVKVKEVMAFPNFMGAFATSVDLGLFLGILFCPPLHFLLPKPGTGPDERAQTSGFLRLTAVATGDKGSQVTGTLYFPSDPGYSSTARMLVEAGLSLLDPQVSAVGGVFTPAACQGPLLLQRLVDSGCWLRVEP